MSDVLLVDDDDVYRATMARALSRRGWAVHEAATASSALSLARARPLSHVAVDLRLPGSRGLELVKGLVALQPGARLVVVTGYGSIATAVEAMRIGAAHFLPKPATAEELDGALRGHPADADRDDAEVASLARVEWEHIQRVLADCGGNVSRAARLLRIERRSLQRKLARHPAPR